MVAQLKQLKAEHVLDDAMRLIPKVRSDAGLVPLVTPTSQIVGSQAVSCALDKLKGNPEYTTVSNQFKALVKENMVRLRSLSILNSVKRLPAVRLRLRMIRTLTRLPKILFCRSMAM